MQEITKCETLVMEVIWQATDAKEDDLSLSGVMERLKQRFGSDWKPQTVSTFLTRLVKKGYLNMYRRGRAFLYHPIISEKEYLDFYMDEEVKRFFDGDYQKYQETVTTFCEAKI